MSEEVSILIIDDDKDMLETLSDILQEKGYQTETAKTGKEAIAKAERHFFNIALIDIKLPDTTGVEVLKTLRTKCPSMMNVMVTGYATVQNAVDSINIGANAYIMKPIDHKKLDQIIKDCLKKQQTFILPQQIPSSLRKPEVKLLLKAIKDGEITEFKPSLNHDKGISYPEIERLIPDSSEYYNILGILERYGIVKKEFYDTALACPSCDSTRISAQFECPSCGSTKIGKQTGIFFRCIECGKTMPMPVHKYVCGNCRGRYTENQIKVKEISMFVVSNTHKSLVNKWITDLDHILECAREFYREVLPPYERTG